ncbi:ParB/RepB/Spo0J family partition protein [Cupriavidus pauculus]|uniref:ParB/RepB/Spo0J family partition protein n=1 Tax=Cupriavidus pauculus TaxID=82633 RepID=UPI001D0CBA39|nr:ParB/RepB/Spo0J family partition protein [Cupriavidus pauculus]
MSNKMKERLMARTANLAANVEADAATRVPIAEQRPMTMPGQLGAFRLEAQRYQATINELTKQLEEARASGGFVEVPLTQLHEVAGRRRYMPPERYAELLQNLRHNALIEPVVIRPREEGGYEIVSGHHRTDAHRDLGRPTVRCVLEKVTAEQADTRAFYANLMQSDLTDYEKYRGFARLLERNPELTQAAMAEASGVDKSVLSRLMSFAELPTDVLEALAKQPALLGARAASELAGLAKEGKAERVSSAVAQLIAGKIDQVQAVKLAATVEKPTAAAPPKPVPFKIKAGRSVYCEMRQTKNVVRLEFQTEDEAALMHEQFKAFLEQRAKAASGNSEKKS